MFILDIKQGPSCAPWELLIVDRHETIRESRFKPFFYVIVDAKYERVILSKVAEIVESTLQRRAVQLEQYGLAPEDSYRIVPCDDLVPLIYDRKEMRYVRPCDKSDYKDFRVYKVIVPIPRAVAESARQIRFTFEQEYPHLADKIRLAWHNVRYILNASLNTPLLILNTVPIYTGVVSPEDIQEALANYEYMVYDVEDVKVGNDRYIVISWRVETLDCTEDLDKAKIETVILKLDEYGFVKNEGDLDYVRYAFQKARVIVDYNGQHYDRELLVQVGILDRSYFENVSALDLLVFVRANASGLGVGQTSLGLQDVAVALGAKAGFKREWIEIKMRKDEMLRDLEKTAKIYNPNDVKLTAALMRVVGKLLIAQAACFKMCPTGLLDLPSGLVYEYFAIKNCLCYGLVPEARRVFDDPRLAAAFTGAKVFNVRVLLEFLNQYVEKLRKLLEEGRYDDYFKELRKAAVEFVRYAERLSHKSVRKRGGEAESEKLLKPFYIDCEEKKTNLDIPQVAKLLVEKDVEIEADDFAMTYPSFAIFRQIDPCAFDYVETCKVLGIDPRDPEAPYKIAQFAEKAVFNIRKYIAPFYAGLLLLYDLRSFYKKAAKELKSVDPLLAAIFDIIQEALKRVLNSYFGAAGKKTGDAHGGHPIAPLCIFKGTIEALGASFLHAYVLGYVPIYGDTDSLFMLVPADKPREAPAKEIEAVIKKLYGLKLDFKARYRKFLYFRRKSYIAHGDDLAVKGRILADLKMILPQGFRPIFLDCLKNGTIRPLVEAILSTDDPERLIATHSRRFLDMFVFDVQSMKTKRRELEADLLEQVERAALEAEEEVEEEGEEAEQEAVLEEEIYEAMMNQRMLWLARGYIQVRYTEPGREDYVVSYLKKPNVGDPRVAVRLVALGLRYGVEVKRGVYVVDFRQRSITDIADLKAVVDPRTREKLRGDFIVLKPDGTLVYASIVKDGCFYVLAEDLDSEEEYRIPLRYDTVAQRFVRGNKRLTLHDKYRIFKDVYYKVYNIDIDRAYILKAVELRIEERGAATIEDLQRAVLRALYTFLHSRGLTIFFRDLDYLLEHIGYIPVTEATEEAAGGVEEEKPGRLPDVSRIAKIDYFLEEAV